MRRVSESTLLGDWRAERRSTLWEKPKLLAGSCTGSGTTEDDAVGHRNGAETYHTVHAAGDFTCGVEARNHLAAGVLNLSFVVNHQATHAVVHARPQAADVIRTVTVGNGILKHHAIEVRILLSFDVAVELLVGLLQFIVRNLVRISKFLQMCIRDRIQSI